MGSYNDRVDQLHAALELMTQKVELKTTLKVTGDNAAALILLQQAIPCILHCANQCDEKILKMFLLEVFNHFAGDVKLQDTFLFEFEEYVNLHV
jgi:hypothetical protein